MEKLVRKKIKQGDVLLNTHASERNPIRRSVIIGHNDQYVFAIYLRKKTIRRCSYYLRDVLYDDAFQIIGHIDLAELLIKAMEESV